MVTYKLVSYAYSGEPLVSHVLSRITFKEDLVFDGSGMWLIDSWLRNIFSLPNTHTIFKSNFPSLKHPYFVLLWNTATLKVIRLWVINYLLYFVLLWNTATLKVIRLWVINYLFAQMQPTRKKVPRRNFFLHRTNVFFSWYFQIP